MVHVDDVQLVSIQNRVEGFLIGTYIAPHRALTDWGE
jgi:hypothetical protein